MRPTVVEFGCTATTATARCRGRDTPADQCYTALLDDFVAMSTVEPPGTRSTPSAGLHLQRVIDAISKKV